MLFAIVGSLGLCLICMHYWVFSRDFDILETNYAFLINLKTKKVVIIDAHVAPQLPNGALYNWSCIDSQGVGTCQLGALTVIMRNAMIALYVIM